MGSGDFLLGVLWTIFPGVDCFTGVLLSPCELLLLGRMWRGAEGAGKCGTSLVLLPVEPLGNDWDDVRPSLGYVMGKA